VKGRPGERKPAGVPETATQAGEAGARRGERWDWVEPVVWTERMLAALEEGVKGGRWFSLMDKVYAERTLRVAWERVRRNGGGAGVDRMRLEDFEARAERYLAELARELREGSYRPQAVRRTWIPKPGRTGQRAVGDTDGQGSGSADGTKAGVGADL
jgi:RNA-directed DNA polymerase